MPSKYERQRERKTPPHLELCHVRYLSRMTLDEVIERMVEHLGRPVTRGALSAIENGHRGASAEMLRALEVAYGLPEGALVTDYEPRNREVLGATG